MELTDAHKHTLYDHGFVKIRGIVPPELVDAALAYFRQHGPQTLLDGMPPLELPAPEQVTAQAGDAVFCHYQLAHGIAGNSSPHIRYAVFFRLCHVDHEAVHWQCMTDIWLEWAGMRDIIAA